MVVDFLLLSWLVVTSCMHCSSNIIRDWTGKAGRSRRREEEDDEENSRGLKRGNRNERIVAVSVVVPLVVTVKRHLQMFFLAVCCGWCLFLPPSPVFLSFLSYSDSILFSLCHLFTSAPLFDVKWQWAKRSADRKSVV